MKSGRPWEGFGLVAFYFAFLAGLAYVIYQWFVQSKIDDPIFVGLLTANTYAMYRFAMFLKQILVKTSNDYHKALLDTGVDFDKAIFIKEIFDKNRSFLTGITFGLVFFFVSLLVAPWGHGSNLNIFLAVFLFAANVITGMGLYSLYKYFKYSLTIGSNIEVDLWDRSNPAISELVEINRYVVLAIAFVACSGMLSIMFSKFNLDYSIVFFSVFSVSIILLAYAIPLMPVTTQIRKKKKMHLGNISKRIQNEYTFLISSSEDKDSNIDITRFDALISVYRSVKGVKAFPPVGEQSVNTAVSVVFLTMLPSIIDFVLSNLTKG